jgi:hypothetical protein
MCKLKTLWEYLREILAGVDRRMMTLIAESQMWDIQTISIYTRPPCPSP